MKLEQLSITQLEERQLQLEKQYDAYKSAGLSLDLTRGKPGAEQLDLSNSLDGILQGFYLLQDGTDVRNYGGLTGIAEARQLGGLFMDLPAKEVMVGGNSSLTLMYNYIHFMMESVWLKESKSNNETIKFLCPVPGYDRHFTICDAFNIEMIPVNMLDDGPDMDHIEGLSPAISIEQKSTSHNPRSTVGTVTEIYDYLRLLFARAGIPRCPDHGEKLEARQVLVATGGTRLAAGARLATLLGHSLETAVPSLFTFKIRDPRFEGLPGVAVAETECRVIGSKLVSSGPLLITHQGVSGPGVLRLSAWGARDLADVGYRFTLQVNWLPGVDVAAVAEVFSGQR